jgi:hypothetical protein
MKPMYTLQPSLPLLRRTQLFPGESLVSLLERLAQINYYSSARILRSICCERLETPANQDMLTRPQWVETFLQLSDLTQISPEALYAASIHRFAPCFTLPQQSLVEIPWIDSASKVMLPTNLAQVYLRFTLAAQYCPLCLKTAAYHHLIWTPVSAAICLEHDCLLVNQCPRCQKQISIQEIVRRQCGGCQVDLSAVEPISVEEDQLGIQSQQLIQACLSGAGVAELPGMGSLPSRHPAVLYHFLGNLSRRLLNCGGDWPSLHTPLNGLADHIAAPTCHLQALAPEGCFHLQKAAFTGIMNWPQGLFQYLDAYSHYTALIQEPADHFKRVQQVYRDWFRPVWRVPDFEFMQQGFVSYLLFRKLPIPVHMAEQFTEVAWFVEQTCLWSETSTAAALNLTTEGLRRFLLCQSVGACRWPNSRISAPIFQRDRVLALQQKWTLGWSISEASAWLGLPPWDVVALVERDILAVVERSEADKAHWILSRPSVEGFFESVVTQLELFRGDPYNLVHLKDASLITAPLGLDQLTLLIAVASGCLPALKREPKIRSLRCIFFLGTVVLDFPDLWYARRGWVEGHTFAYEKGLHPQLLTQLVGAGQIKPEAVFGWYQYFDRHNLEQLLAMFFPT